VALSDSQWREWLESSSSDPVILVEAQYHDSSTKTAYFSDKGYIDPFSLSAPNYLPVIQSDVVIEDELDASLISSIDIDVYDPAMLGFQWIGFNFRIYYGDRSWPRANFRQVAFNKTANFTSPHPDKARFDFSDLGRYYFDQLITGNGRGLTVGLPFVFGKVFNMQPVRSTSVRFTYYTPAIINGPLEVRDRGVPLTSTVSHIIPDGTGDGLRIDVQLPVAPSGEVTMDLGDFGFYSSSRATLNRIVTQINSYIERPIPVSSSVALFDSVELGYVCYTHTSVLEMLTQLCESVGANPRINETGELELIRISPGGTSTHVITDANLDAPLFLEEREPPYLALNLGYQKNWTLQTSNLAASLSEANYTKYGTDFSFLTASQSLPAYPASKPQRKDTLIFDENEAQAELDRRFGLRTVERQRFSAKGDASFIADRVGDTVTVESDDFGFSAGADFVVLAIRKNLSTRKCEAQLWK
jgi:hypothetical protein